MMEVKAVAVCGQICSGKTSVLNYLAQKYSWNIVSFSNYIKDVARERGLAPIRETLQELGQNLFESMPTGEFLRAAVNARQPVTSVHLFDSIRHLPVIEALRQIYTDSVVIYLSASLDLRYNRYLHRAATSDRLVSYQEFQVLDIQVVERNIQEIAKVADLCIDNSSTFETVIAQLKKLHL